jgi:hypothetical protein
MGFRTNSSTIIVRRSNNSPEAKIDSISNEEKTVMVRTSTKQKEQWYSIRGKKKIVLCGESNVSNKVSAREWKVAKYNRIYDMRVVEAEPSCLLERYCNCCS